MKRFHVQHGGKITSLRRKLVLFGVANRQPWHVRDSPRHRRSGVQQLRIVDDAVHHADRERLAAILRRYCGGAPPASVLVVEDDAVLRALTCRLLQEEGWAVIEADNGRTALERAAAGRLALILLDLLMPELDGFEFIAELRQREAGRGIPIVVLSAVNNETDMKRGYSMGIKQYLTKPFEMDVLKARVRALLRRTGSTSSETFAFGDLVIDRLEHQARVAGRPLAITPKEFSLLEYLVMHADQVVTRSVLLEKVWDLHFDPGSNVVDVHMARLRTKLRRSGAKPQVATVRGVGYRLTLAPGD